MLTQCGIIPALDLDIKSIAGLVTKLKSEEIAWYKVGSIPIMKHGLKVICETIKKRAPDQPLMLDMQKGATDIPYIVERQVETAKEFGIDAYIGAPLGAGSCRDPNGTLEAFVGHCRKWSITPIVLMSMTQAGSDFFLKDDAFTLIAERICDLGVRHVVLPANKPEKIRLFRSLAEDRGLQVSVVSPGVGPQKTGDPTVDAIEAVRAGADYLVIGRAIYRNDNPAFFVRELLEKIAEARKLRERKHEHK